MTEGHKPLRLSRFQPVRRDVEAEKHAGWHDHGILVVAANDPRLGWPEREMVQHLARTLFGTHKGANHG